MRSVAAVLHTARMAVLGGVVGVLAGVSSALFLEQVLHVTSCEYNVVADCEFDLPAQIKALIK